MVDGKAINSCLGDEFSVRWMEDTDAATISTETIGQQVTKVVAAVTKSHVQQYGAKTFDSEPIGDFQGINGVVSTLVASAPANGNGVNSRQVEVHQAYYKVLRAETADKRKVAEQGLSAILAQRKSADLTFAAIASFAAKGDETKAEELLEGPVDAFNASCHKAVLKTVVEHCGAFGDYSLRYSRLFANMCETTMSQQEMTAAIEEGCGGKIVV